MKLAKLLWIPAAVVIVVAGSAAFAQTMPHAPADTAAAPAAATTTKTTATAAAKTPAVKIDVAVALAPRSLGDPKAPVKVDEYASLSCSHCAAFSKETFDKFKAEYIDTGKVYYTFHDFPLNAPALEAAMVTRCLPPEHYFQFVKFLFDTQDKWAFNEHYNDALKQNSKLVGLDDATFDSCVNNQDLKQGIIDKMQAAATAKKNPVQATPTFLINNGEAVVGGAAPLETFQAKIDPLVAAAGGVKAK